MRVAKRICPQPQSRVEQIVNQKRIFFLDQPPVLQNSLSAALDLTYHDVCSNCDVCCRMEKLASCWLQRTVKSKWFFSCCGVEATSMLLTRRHTETLIHCCFGGVVCAHACGYNKLHLETADHVKVSVDNSRAIDSTVPWANHLID